MTRARIWGTDTPFGNWTRNHPELDSVRHGITINDQDYMIHKYKTNVDGLGARVVQLMMNTEVKTNGAMPSNTQRQTLFFEHQLLNKRRTLNDVLSGRKSAVWHFGCFVLSIPESYPGEYSDTVIWCRFGDDGSLIPSELTVDQLVGVLSFRLNPITLAQLSLRRHHKKMAVVSTEKVPLGFSTDCIVTRKS